MNNDDHGLVIIQADNNKYRVIDTRVRVPGGYVLRTLDTRREAETWVNQATR